ncbi:AAA family ATPase [Algoriphagus sanaruensis]|uniref:AAA+ ATPase domain-containing protein n=1 Tax=Algoriphagus sanaruensis TaxID=1727163 RepID=A0A142EKG2_9BACT|nr:AAA family ATPase [Algoriphagus sanaruensis]AMQ55617.1 hypothetical protein AO498_04315 [Algoriphagus sanaruensis]
MTQKKHWESVGSCPTNSPAAKGIQSIADSQNTQIDVKIPENSSLNDQTVSTNNSSISRFKTARELFENDIIELPCLIHPIIQKMGLMALAGSSDTGKSTLLRQLALDVICGNSQFIGFDITATHQRVIIVSTEDDALSISSLIKKQAVGIPPEKLENLVFLFDDENLLENLEKEISTYPVDLVIIDCFSDAFGQELKDTHRIRNYLNDFQRLANRHQCLFIYLHHTGKRTEDLEPSKNNLLSGQGFEAKMRLVIELRKDRANPNLRHFCIVKGNYLPNHLKSESIELEFDQGSFRFKPTGKRIPFSDLVKKGIDEDLKAKFLLAKKLEAEGKSQEEIAPIVGYSGKGSVSKLLKSGREKGW